MQRNRGGAGVWAREVRRLVKLPRFKGQNARNMNPNRKKAFGPNDLFRDCSRAPGNRHGRSSIVENLVVPPISAQVLACHHRLFFEVRQANRMLEKGRRTRGHPTCQILHSAARFGGARLGEVRYFSIT